MCLGKCQNEIPAAPKGVFPDRLDRPPFLKYTYLSHIFIGIGPGRGKSKFINLCYRSLFLSFQENVPSSLEHYRCNIIPWLFLPKFFFNFFWDTAFKTSHGSAKGDGFFASWVWREKKTFFSISLSISVYSAYREGEKTSASWRAGKFSVARFSKFRRSLFLRFSCSWDVRICPRIFCLSPWKWDAIGKLRGKGDREDNKSNRQPRERSWHRATSQEHHTRSLPPHSRPSIKGHEREWRRKNKKRKKKKERKTKKAFEEKKKGKRSGMKLGSDLVPEKKSLSLSLSSYFRLGGKGPKIYAY